jgi:hypothetical protein
MKSKKIEITEEQVIAIEKLRSAVSNFINSYLTEGEMPISQYIVLKEAFDNFPIIYRGINQIVFLQPKPIVKEPV